MRPEAGTRAPAAQHATAGTPRPDPPATADDIAVQRWEVEGGRITARADPADA